MCNLAEALLRVVVGVAVSFDMGPPLLRYVWLQLLQELDSSSIHLCRNLLCSLLTYIRCSMNTQQLSNALPACAFVMFVGFSVCTLLHLVS